MPLGGDNKLLVRGIAVDSVYLAQGDDMDWSTKKHHLLWLRWFLPDVYQGASQTCLAHVAGLDLTRKWLLLEETLVLSIPWNTKVAVEILLGPYVNIACEDYAMLSDQKSSLNAASKVIAGVRTRDIARHLLSPSLVLEPARRDKEQLVCFLGGPGIGKTTEEGGEPLRACARDGSPALLLSSLNSVRNNQVAALQHIVGEDLFELRVRCEGQRDLDELSRSRTVDALVWKSMKPVVRAHEHIIPLRSSAACTGDTEPRHP